MSTSWVEIKVPVPESAPLVAAESGETGIWPPIVASVHHINWVSVIYVRV